MADILYRWPEPAKFGRRVPKEKLYEHGTVSTAVREKFTKEVKRITWAYKLAEATINLPGTPTVPEVQVFVIDAKTKDVSESVLGVIDKAVPFPIIFEITRQCGEQPEVRMVAAHKQLGTGTPKIGAYYSTGWQTADTERQAMPTTITLPTLYTALLQPLTPITMRPGEAVAEVADRLATVCRLKREVARLERKIRTEPQLNRKVELRRTLKTKQQELEEQR
ncbi:DUF4391 domain-containing protein [Rothia kristinae]